MKSNDLISRAALLEEFQGGGFVFECVIRSIIEGAPAIDAEPVRHGRWIVRVQHTPGCDIGEWDEYFFANCSECGREIFLDDIACACGDFKKACAEYPYCHCGAKMDLEVQDDA